MEAAKKTIRVAAAIIVDGGRVFATQRGYGERKDWWEFPGGKIEQGEQAEEALRREIKEELDINIEVGELVDIVEYDYPNFHLLMNCYQCSIANPSRIRLMEHEDARWLTKDELRSVNWLPADIEILQKVEMMI